MQLDIFSIDRPNVNKTVRMEWLDPKVLKPHPKNPRRGNPQKIEAYIESMREEGYRPDKPMLVRPFENGFQIVGGHSRQQAAIAAGLDKVWCCIEEMDDEESILRLAQDNLNDPFPWYSQAIYVVENTIKDSKKGLSRTALVKAATGKEDNAADHEGRRLSGCGIVLLFLEQSAIDGGLLTELYDPEQKKTLHLAAIHKAPEQYWQKLTEMLIEKEWSVKETEAIVSKVKAIADLECPPWLSGILKLDEAWVKAIEDERLSGTLTSCARAAMAAYESFGIEVVEIVENGEIRNEEWDLQARYVDLLVSTPGIGQNLTPGKFDPPRKVLNRQVEELRRQAEKFKLGQAEGVERKRLEEEERLRKQQLAAEYKPVGHCGAFGEVLFQLTPNSFDLVLTDPPYLLSNDGITARGNKQVSVNKNFSDRSGEAAPPESWLPDCLKLLKPGGVLVFTCTEHLNMTSARLEAQGFEYLERLFWIKRSAPPRLTPTGHRACVEEIWVARKPGETHFFNYELLKENYWKGKQASNYLEFEQCSGNERLGWHDTQKPLSLWKYLLEAYCPEDGTVLDPFSGSGTTAVAAKQLRRKATWVELSNEFFNLANDRLEKSPYFWEVE